MLQVLSCSEAVLDSSNLCTCKNRLAHGNSSEARALDNDPKYAHLKQLQLHHLPETPDNHCGLHTIITPD